MIEPARSARYLTVDREAIHGAPACDQLVWDRWRYSGRFHAIDLDALVCAWCGIEVAWRGRTPDEPAAKGG